MTPDREGLIDTALAGAGISRMACFDPAPGTRGRRRRPVTDWDCTDGFNVYALHRKGSRLAPRIQAVLEFVRESFDAFDPEGVMLKRPA